MHWCFPSVVALNCLVHGMRGPVPALFPVSGIAQPGKKGEQDWTEQFGTKQDRTEQDWTEQDWTEQDWTEQ